MRSQLLENELIQMKNWNDDLQQYIRQNNLWIYGLPEKENEFTDDLVSQLCKENLEINVILWRDADIIIDVNNLTSVHVIFE